MEKRFSTFLSCLAFLFILSPTLFAQQNTTESNNDILVIQKATGEDGTLSIEKKELVKGEKFESYLELLNLDRSDNKDVKIEVITGDYGDVDQQTSSIDDEETIFIFKRGKTSHDENDELEKLVITLNDLEDEVVKEDKPLLGVYSEQAEEGVKITGLVYNSGAQKAGLKKGDIITSLNGTSINSPTDLSAAIQSNKVDDIVVVDFIRNGVSQTLTATLGAKPKKNSHHRNYSYHYDYDNDHYYNSFQDRDPCKVFIGVYTSNSRQGLKVHNLIANTPAEKANVQLGDIIIAIDDVEVNSHQQLVTQRDLHKAGDFFTLSVIRDGQQIEIDAQFEACQTDKVLESVVEETTSEIEEIINTPIELTQNTLELEQFSTFPNPTFGPINLQFKGEAVPTTIRITDTTGKLIYEEVLNNFDGNFNGTINYKKAVPGTLILSVVQDQKIFSQAIVLMERA